MRLIDEEMTMKTLMILGASILQLPAIEQAVKMGLKVVVADMNPDAIGFSVKGVIKEVISTIDTDKLLEAAKKHKIDGIITLATDLPMRSVARVSKELGLIGISEETAIKATNKSEMRKALALEGVPIPEFYSTNDYNSFEYYVNTLLSKYGKCIVKPADSSGSRGISYIQSDFESDFELIFKRARDCSHSGTVMIEEYMEGPEVSVETIALNGIVHVIQITDKLTTGAPHFVEIGHSQPSLLSNEIKEKISSVAVAANHAIGIKNGPSHTEIKLTKTGPKVVEIGARLGGDNITTHLTPLSTGVNMVESIIKIALGETSSISKKVNKGAAIRYFPQHKGIITKIEGIKEAKNVKGVVQVNIVHGVCEDITEIIDSGSRIGFVIAQGNTVHDAISACNEAISKVRFDIK